MGPEQIRVRAEVVLAWAVGFGVTVDAWADGPPGLGVLLAASLAGLGLVWVARPRPQAVAFLAAGLILAAFVVVRASPVLVGLDLLAATGLFALAGAFAREGDPLRAGLRAYSARAVAWAAFIPTGAALLLRPFSRLLPRDQRSLAAPRAVLIALPVGLAFALLLGSADAVFAQLLRAPFEGLPWDDLLGHVVVIAAATLAFATLAARSTVPIRLGRAARPIEGGWLRQVDWISILVTVDTVFAFFVAVQVVAFFGGRPHVLAETDLTFAEYARSGFWQMLAAAALTGLVIAAAWVGGRPAIGRQRAWFTILACAMVGLSLVVLASAFERLVLYETEFGYTWPRLIPHLAILLTGALLACGLVAIVIGRTTWLPAAALVLGLLGLTGLNLMDPEAFIADRNIARLARGYELDTVELAALSADAVPTIAAALPRLDPSIRYWVERDLSCLREELRAGVERHGWASFNVGRDIALERLNPLALPDC
jgi:hypothetical protein